MSQVNLGSLGFKVVIDDSELLPMIRGAFAKAQAEVESRGIKIPLTVEPGTPGAGRSATFATSSAPGASAFPVASAAGFNPYRAASRDLWSFNTSAMPTGFSATTPAAPPSGGFTVSPAQQQFGYAAQTAAAQATGAQGFGVVQAYRNLFYNTVNNGPAPSPRPAPSTPGGSAFNSRFALTMGLLGAHELIRAYSASAEGDFRINTATNQADALKAAREQYASVYSGFFGSLIGSAKDLAGAGPETFSLSTNRTLSLIESQRALRDAQLSSRFDPMERAALVSGDSIERRRTTARRALAEGEEKYGPDIKFTQEQLAGTHKEQYITGYRATMGGDPTLSAGNLNHTAGYGEPIYGTRDVLNVQGTDREILKNKLETLKLNLEKIRKDAGAELDAINREVSTTGRGMRFETAANTARANGRNNLADFTSLVGRTGEAISSAPHELKGDAEALARSELARNRSDTLRSGIGRGLSYVGEAGDAMIDARQMARQSSVLRAQRTGGAHAGRLAEIDASEEEQMDRTQAIPKWLRWLPQLGIHGLSQEKRNLENSQFDRESNIMNTQLGGRSTMLDMMLKRNPIGAEAVGIGTSALADAQALMPERPAQARMVLGNAIKDEDLLKQDYKNQFRGEQIDPRLTYVGNARDQESPDSVIKTIEKQTQDLKEALNNLVSD